MLHSLIPLLQLTDTAFPSGGFACSWGMEALVQRGLVTDRSGADAVVRAALLGTVGAVEGPAVTRAYRAVAGDDLAVLTRLDDLLDSFAPAQASRAASRRVGRRFLQAALLLCPALGDRLGNCAAAPAGMHHATAVGAAGAGLALPAEAVLAAFLTTWCTQQLQAAARLIPLGQADVVAAQGALQPAILAAVARGRGGRIGARIPAVPLADTARFVQPWLERRLFVC